MSTFDSKINNWSTTASENGEGVNVPPNGWKPAMAIADIDDTGRQMMVDHRNQWQDAQWFNYHADAVTISRLSNTSFLIEGVNGTSDYVTHRRIKLKDGDGVGGATTYYGEVVSSSFSSPDTTVNVRLDSGALTSSLSSVALSILTPTNVSIPKTTASYNNNLLINGDFIIAQREDTFASITSGVYCLDRWVALSGKDGGTTIDGAMTVIQDLTDIPTDGRSSVQMKLTSTATTNSAKAGLVQIIEAKNCAGAIGDTVSLNFTAKKGSGNGTVDLLRAGIIQWSKTADSVGVTSLVSDWKTEGTNPTLKTDASFANTPANLTLSATYKSFSIESVDISANTQNIAVMIWVDNDDPTANDTVNITDVHLNIGSGSGKFERKLVQEELADCQRYYEKSYDQGTAPGTNTTGGVVNVVVPYGSDGSQGYAYPRRFNQNFKAVKRNSSATVSFYTPTGTADNISCGVTDETNSLIAAAVDKPITGGSAQWTQTKLSDNGVFYSPNANTTFITIGSTASSTERIGFMQYHYTADAEL